MYAIVKFLDEDGAPGVVCSHWINEEGTSCFFPNVATNKGRDKLLRQYADPEKNWSSCRIKVLRGCNNFNHALQYVKKAASVNKERTDSDSDNESTCNKRQNKKRNHLLFRGEDSDEDSMPSSKSQRIKYETPSSELLNSPAHPSLTLVSLNEDESICDKRRKKKSNMLYPEEEWDKDSMTSTKSQLIIPEISSPELLNSPSHPSPTVVLLNEDESICDKRRRKKRNLLYPGEESDEDSMNSVKSQQIKCEIPSPELINSPVPNLCVETLYENDENPNYSSNSSSQEAISNGQIVSLMANISSKVNKMENTLSKILLIQEKMLGSNRKETKPTENFSTLCHLPIVRDEDFQSLCLQLAVDTQVRDSLMKILVYVGGKDIRSHAQYMLKRVLTDEVAEHYSLTGKSTIKNTTKKSFQCTEFFKLICLASLKRFKDHASEQKVKEAVSDWLNQAKVRKIRKKERREDAEAKKNSTSNQ